MAILGGMLGVALGCRIVRLPFWTVADCAAPGVVLAQAIGRVGNYTNQELYGHPSALPWAIRIAHPLPPYVPGEAFQPTFLYEALWDLAVLGMLVWFVRRTANRVRPGTVFALYAGLYSLGRLWIETIRIDPTEHVLGQRVDIWVAALVCILAGGRVRRPLGPAPRSRVEAPQRIRRGSRPRRTASSDRARLAKCRAIATGAGERRSITVADRSRPGSDAASTWPSATTDRQLPIAAGSWASEEAAWGRSHARAHCSARALPAAAQGPPLQASTMSSSLRPRSSSRASGRSRPRTRR